MFGKNDYCEIHFDNTVLSMNPSYNKVLETSGVASQCLGLVPSQHDHESCGLVRGMSANASTHHCCILLKGGRLMDEMATVLKTSECRISSGFS